MKKFALAIIVIAFGAVMVAGCPAANNGGKKANTTKANTTKANDTKANAE
jgi:hypothetical protein